MAIPVDYLILIMRTVAWLITFYDRGPVLALMTDKGLYAKIQTFASIQFVESR